ncbi:MAG: dihydrolipoyllysine-residue acetyltransferase [Legionellales bacterium]|nr:dihydrolipoyllysine-residue acetyltransferase [Legionellales bacterium]
MSSQIEIKVPDLGGASEVDVIEVMVASGDRIAKDDSLITLESDKASMDIPAPQEGVVTQVKLKEGDKASQGDVILLLEALPSAEATKQSQQQTTKTETTSADANQTTEQTIVVPDIGGATDVDVIEVMVTPGDQITKDDSLITLESDKASMDVPSPYSGTMKSVVLKVGAKVSQGDAIAVIEITDAAANQAAPIQPPETVSSETATKSSTPAATPSSPTQQQTASSNEIYAGPAVRRMAREFDLDLTQIIGTGPKGRIQTQDVQHFVKQRMQAGRGVGLSVPTPPVVDFSQFGEVTSQPLTKIKRLTGENVHRNWLTIPHVTQFDQADITELEAFRQANKHHAEQQGFKLTPLAFIMKVVVKALQTFPQFNASLDPSGQQLIYKKYFHLGVAVETPNGLVVPVIRDVDGKGVLALAQELASISQKAREKRLMPNEMTGSCMSISSLGGIGGTAFTPIINGTDVAILGISRASTQPVWQHDQFIPRLMLPLSLSYDHRVIDGAEAARFTQYLADCLGDIRHLVL